MPNLIETYARSTGLKIGSPYTREDFYPLPFTRYITLSAGSGQAAKNYDYFQEVVDLLNPLLDPHGIRVILLGAANEPLIRGTTDLRGQTTLAQSQYLIHHALLHLGNDSWGAHAAGWFKTPLVALYGSTDSYLHGPNWQGPRTTLLESHRRGHKPSFGPEYPKTINYIEPERVANAVLAALSVDVTINQRTVLMGPLYGTVMLEWIPNFVLGPDFSPDVPVTARMDLHFDETSLTQLLQTGRKVNIVTKAPINLQIIAAFKGSILSYNHEMFDDCSRDYVSAIKKLVPRSMFFCRSTDDDYLARLRFAFFDVCTIERAIDKTRADFERDAAVYLNKPLDIGPSFDILRFKTSKYVLSSGKIYPSNAHVRRDQQMSADQVSQVIDDEVFWREMNHQRFFL